jgi:hypothetical protein
MYRSRIAYYADFVVYPLLIGVMLPVIADDANLRDATLAVGFATIGALLWTLLEYLLHRFLLHGDTRMRTCMMSITPARVRGSGPPPASASLQLPASLCQPLCHWVASSSAQ